MANLDNLAVGDTGYFLMGGNKGGDRGGANQSAQGTIMGGGKPFEKVVQGEVYRIDPGGVWMWVELSELNAFDEKDEYEGITVPRLDNLNQPIAGDWLLLCAGNPRDSIGKAMQDKQLP